MKCNENKKLPYYIFLTKIANQRKKGRAYYILEI